MKPDEPTEPIKACLTEDDVPTVFVVLAKGVRDTAHVSSL